MAGSQHVSLISPPRSLASRIWDLEACGRMLDTKYSVRPEKLAQIGDAGRCNSRFADAANGSPNMFTVETVG